MSTLAKISYLAPIAITTAGVAALISFNIDDPKTKKRIRTAAAILALGSLFTVLTQAVDFLDHWNRSRVSASVNERIIAEERAKAAEAQRQFESVRATAEQDRLKTEVERRRMQTEIEANRQKLEAAAVQQKAQLDRLREDQAAALKLAQEENRRRLLALEAENSRLAAEAGRERSRRGEEVNRSCSQCCNANATRGNKYDPQQAVAVCMDECRSGRPSNWFGNNVVLCPS